MFWGNNETTSSVSGLYRVTQMPKVPVLKYRVFNGTSFVPTIADYQTENNKFNIEQSKLNLENAKIQADMYNQAADRQVKREEMQNQLNIAKTNKNKYDKYLSLCKIQKIIILIYQIVY